MSDLIPGGYVTRRAPKPTDLAGAQHAVNALAVAKEDALALHEEFTGHGFPSLEATILTLATIMLTPEADLE